MTIYYQCDNCRKTSSEHELVRINEEKGDPICRHCWGFVSRAFSACTAEENKTTAEALEDLKKDCADHWEMIKARVFITLFLVWVCFAIWGKYVS